jgi:hypothetical protein
MRLVLPPRSAWGKQSRCHRQSPTKAANEAGCGKPGFYRADTLSSNGHACPNSGAIGPKPVRQHPEELVKRAEFWSGLPTLQYGELLAKRQILQKQSATRTKATGHQSQTQPGEVAHAP